MNKKAAVMFWAIPIFVAALVLYLVLSDAFSLAAEPKGTWQLDFLNKNYLQAEKNLLLLDSTAKNIGQETALDLARNGGFLEGQQSECGSVDGVNLWNIKEKFCFPDVEKNVKEKVGGKLKLRIKNGNFEEIKYNGNILSAKGRMDTVKSTVGSYTFDTSFSVYLGYSFDEYSKLQEEGLRLVSSCRENENLKECLDNAKKDYWKYGSCEDEGFPEGKIVSFCVGSPGLYYIDNEQVSYEIAFDFS